MSLRPLSLLETRVLGVLVEKQHTVPDSYPLSLNALTQGCNQKTAREPVMNLSEAEVLEALNELKGMSLVQEVSGSRVVRFEHNLRRVYGVPGQAEALLTVLMLRGPQTAAELRLNAERWYRFVYPAEVEGFLNELPGVLESKGGPLAVLLPRAPGEREARWAQLLGGPVTTESIAYGAHPSSAGSSFDAQAERIARLETELAALQATVARLCAELGVSPDGPTAPAERATSAG